MKPNPLLLKLNTYVTCAVEERSEKMFLNHQKMQKKNHRPKGRKMARSGTDVKYDFSNIFAKKFSENIGIFCSNYC
jgi:hypothetical protein